MRGDSISLDKIDHKIIQKLLEDGRASFSRIAKEVNLTDVAIKKRFDSLVRKGVISSVSADLNLKVLGYENPIYVLIRSEPGKTKDLIKKISALDNILELYQTLGEYNLIAKLVVPSLDSTERFLNDLGKIDGVIDVKTQVVISEVKKTSALPTHSLQKRL
jgi:Lrp/AsnC family transcriptional regulator for asnA, asnC and gidA